MTKTPFPRPPHASKHCRHYSYRSTGLEGFQRGEPGGPECGVGVELGNSPVTKCMPDADRPPCAFREEYTDAEHAAWQAYRDESRKRMLMILPLIPGDSRDDKNKPEWGKSGSFDCPACKIGKVRWARARINGHVHAACSTLNCFSVMQ